MATSADIEDLNPPACDPIGVAAGLELYEEYDTAGQYSVFVRWGSLVSPFEFDRVAYAKSGTTVTTGLCLGTRASLTEMDASGNTHWIISSIVVHFKLPDPVKITITTRPDPEAGGTTIPERKVLTVFPGKRWSTTLHAIPKIGYKFDEWRRTGGGSQSRTMSMVRHVYGTAGSSNEELEFVAYFSSRGNNPPAPDAPYDPNYDPTSDPNWPQYSFITVYTDSDPDGVATTTPDGITYVGYTNSYKVVTCTATRKSPDGDGYEFIRWTGSTQAAITQSKYADGSGGTMRSSLKFPSTPGEVLVVRFTAHYKKISTYKVTTTPEPLDGGATAGDGDYAQNETCVAVARPADGSKFLKWKDGGGNVVSRSAVYSFAVTQDVDLTALFHRWTNLILRSATSGAILHGSGGTILHDA